MERSLVSFIPGGIKKITKCVISPLIGSPSKKRHLETEEEGSSGDVNEMDVQEAGEEQEEGEEQERKEDQEMDIGQDSSHDKHHPKICQG